MKTIRCGVLDVRADLDNGEVCDIEMQVATQGSIEKRILFYWSKLYYSGIHKGGKYKELNKTIAILITSFEVNTIKEIPNFHTKWEIREEKYSKAILTDALEIHIIELSKLTEQLKEGIISPEDKAATWAKFILNPNMLEGREMDEGIL